MEPTSEMFHCKQCGHSFILLNAYKCDHFLSYQADLIRHLIEHNDEKLRKAYEVNPHPPSLS